MEFGEGCGQHVCVHSFKDFPKNENVCNVKNYTVKLSKDVGFDKVEVNNVEDLLDSYKEELRNEELIQVDELQKPDEKEADNKTCSQADYQNTSNASNLVDELLTLFEK
ncbi:hypothetical protein Hamer_G002201 [Homarus americanus]|uniref:Uncharacterized protein n=1 Tax=Homarus americanus TaxID=6706 RepID=A0A8J5JS20_HOMAM|nr:hypothetical protein Hamer_G002201 [Homarus americanus]